MQTLATAAVRYGSHPTCGRREPAGSVALLFLASILILLVFCQLHVERRLAVTYGFTILPRALPGAPLVAYTLKPRLRYERPALSSNTGWWV